MSWVGEMVLEVKIFRSKYDNFSFIFRIYRVEEKLSFVVRWFLCVCIYRYIF